MKGKMWLKLSKTSVFFIHKIRAPSIMISLDEIADVISMGASIFNIAI